MNVIHRKLRHGREVASQRAIAATTGIPTPSLLPIVHQCPVGVGLNTQTVTAMFMKNIAVIGVPFTLEAWSEGGLLQDQLNTTIFRFAHIVGIG